VAATPAALSTDSEYKHSGHDVHAEAQRAPCCVSQLPEIIHLTQSRISDVKAWMQLNNDKTEMVLNATKSVLNSDSVLRFTNLEGSDIKTCQHSSQPRWSTALDITLCRLHMQFQLFTPAGEVFTFYRKACEKRYPTQRVFINN